MKKRILFVVDNLVMGGVTKVLINLLNKMDYKKYDIDLLVLHDRNEEKSVFSKELKIINGNKYFSYVDESIKNIIKEKNIKKFFKKFQLVRKIKNEKVKSVIEKFRKEASIDNYDVEIAFSDGFSHIFVAEGNATKKIAWMHTDISIQNDSKRYYSYLKRCLQNMDLCICVSDKVKEAYKEIYQLENIDVIHNIIDDKKIINLGNEKMDLNYSNDVINIVSVGRLEYSKNYENFVEVHNRLIKNGYKVNSYLVGDGIEKENLKDLITKNNLEETFKMLGRKDNPYPYIKNADLFLLTSRYEGLPTVLYEAVILNVPCVSTKVAGAEEILQDKYGIVVENDIDLLYKAVEQMIIDKKRYSEYKNNVLEYQCENEKNLKKIEEIL